MMSTCLNARIRNEVLLVDRTGPTIRRWERWNREENKLHPMIGELRKRPEKRQIEEWLHRLLEISFYHGGLHCFGTGIACRGCMSSRLYVLLADMYSPILQSNSSRLYKLMQRPRKWNKQHSRNTSTLKTTFSSAKHCNYSEKKPCLHSNHRRGFRSAVRRRLETNRPRGTMLREMWPPGAAHAVGAWYSARAVLR